MPREKRERDGEKGEEANKRNSSDLLSAAHCLCSLYAGRCQSVECNVPLCRETKEEQRNLQVHEQLVLHASTCKGCLSNNCKKIKEFLNHGERCEVGVKKGCIQCKRVNTMVHLHAGKCQSVDCNVPRCREIKALQRSAAATADVPDSVFTKPKGKMVTASAAAAAREAKLKSRVAEFDLAHRRFLQQYTSDSKLGGGSYGDVWRCTHKFKPSMVFAVKRICPSTLDKQLTKNPRETEKDKIAFLQRETDHMVKINTHPHLNIIRIEECIWTDSGILALIVMQYAGGIDLKQWISKDRLSEPKARMIIKQVIKAVAHLHSLDIMHGNIKPDKIMATNGADPETGAPLVKLIDFGLAKALTGKDGTPHSKESDCHAVGLVLFNMVSQSWPRAIITDADWPTHSPPLSDSFKDLVLGLTRLNPAERYTMEEALRDPWFTAA
jgi:hypothetical protein